MENCPEVSLVLLCPYLAKSAPYGSSQYFFLRGREGEFPDKLNLLLRIKE